MYNQRLQLKLSKNNILEVLIAKNLVNEVWLENLLTIFLKESGTNY